MECEAGGASRAHLILAKGVGLSKGVGRGQVGGLDEPDEEEADELDHADGARRLDTHVRNEAVAPRLEAAKLVPGC